MTLGAYAAHWLDRSRVRYRPGTLRGYRSVLACHILPALGARPLTALTRREVRGLLVSLLARGLSVGAVHMVHAVLSAILSAAEEDELVRENVAHGAARKLWKRRPDECGKGLTQSEFAALISASRRRYPLLIPFWILLAHTGLRPGEGLGLRADDVDLAAARLRVVRTYHGAGYFGPVKSGRPRLVPLNRDAIAAIRTCLETARPPQNWLFSRDGTLPFAPCYPQAAFRVLRAELQFANRVTPHSLRHSCATWLIERGAREVHVQRLLGHHSIQLTIDLYARGADLPPIVSLLEDSRRHHHPPLAVRLRGNGGGRGRTLRSRRLTRPR